MRRDESYLLDIHTAAQDAVRFVRGMDFPRFAQDDLIRRAAVNCLHEIGEASNKLSAKFRHEHPLIPWGDFISHRNELAHQYFRADFGQV